MQDEEFEAFVADRVQAALAGRCAKEKLRQAGLEARLRFGRVDWETFMHMPWHMRQSFKLMGVFRRKKGEARITAP